MLKIPLDIAVYPINDVTEKTETKKKSLLPVSLNTDPSIKESLVYSFSSLLEPGHQSISVN